MALRNPFRVDWDALTLEDVTAFFDSEPDELLLVEAKGIRSTDAAREGNRGRHVTKQLCGFGNSDLGGYLVLGVSQGNDGFTVDGWEFGRDEPKPWVSRIARSTLDPAPPFDVMSWPLADDTRAVAVIRIWPVSVPPCITTRGELYGRLPGETPTIKSADQLRRLFEKGERARSFAWEQSRAGRDDIGHQESPDGRGRFHGVVVSVGCPSFERDLAALIYRRPLVEAATSLLQGPEWKTYVGSGADPGMSIVTDINQHALTVYSIDPLDGEGYTIRFRRSGSVAIGACSGAYQDPAAGEPIIERLWLAASRFARILHEAPLESGDGWPAHVAVRLGTNTRKVDIDRWADLEAPKPDHLASVQHEIRWSQGLLS